MADADQSFAQSPWQREEFADLIVWMRAYDREHPQRPVHFAGEDMNLPGIGDQLFDRATSYARGAALPRRRRAWRGCTPSCARSRTPSPT
ncbi:erythromycin esterase family protein [Kitasatospora xanthocidica]|uniref:erythromycin esterase family protein n=1 Tax=Kitasatospora xanthocidica TaxID=83382 RepID=UPI0036E73763